MVTYSKELSRIKDILRKNPQGMTITDISKELDVYRKTTAKYLDMLLITGQVEMRPFGPVKIYTPSRRLPVSSMLSFSPDLIMVLDRDLKIVQINERFPELYSGDRKELIGSQLGGAGLPFTDNPGMIEGMTEAVNGKESAGEAVYALPEGDRSFRFTLMPVTFDDGSKGVTLKLEDVAEKRKLENDVRNRDKLLRAIGFLVSGVSAGDQPDRTLRQGLRMIGEAAELSRVYICENEVNGDGRFVMRRILEWAAEGIESLMADDDFATMPYRTVGERLEETLSKGKAYFGHVHDFLPEEREVFEGQGIRSVAIIPIFVNREWWGFLGSDQCLKEWEWSSSEIETLKAAAGVIGIIKERGITEERRG